MKNARLLSGLTVLVLSVFPARAGDTGPLRIGAARVDVTPTASKAAALRNVWGNAYQGIHDPIYVRAVVLDNGLTSAALVSIDTSSTPDTSALRRRIEESTGVPAAHVFISATHTHNAPAVGPRQARDAGPDSAEYTATVENAILDTIRQSKARLQPGRMGVATGHADININRDEFVGDRWKTGRNPSRPSDKTVWVLKFENTAGEPIAFFVNYGVHALMLGPDNVLITGDLPGATSRFIESYYQDKVVALWTSGAGGDQNPIASSWDLDDVLTRKVREPGEQGFQLSDSLGRILGEEAIRAASGIRDAASTVSIWSMSRDTTCPGQRLDQQALQRGEFKFNDIEAQTLHLDLLMINQIALAGVAAEVVTNIYYHLKQESPLTNTILVSLTNGRLTYIPDDAAYDAPIFEVRASSLKRGCGEGTIVYGFKEMIHKRLAAADSSRP